MSAEWASAAGGVFALWLPWMGVSFKKLTRELLTRRTRQTQQQSQQMRDFFLKVEQRLREKGLTIEQFSKAVGISPATYHRWQTGAIPRGSTVRRVARVLDLPFEQFFRPVADLASEPQSALDVEVMKRLTEGPSEICRRMADPELLQYHSEFLAQMVHEPREVYRATHATMLGAIANEFDLRLKSKSSLADTH